MNDTLLSQFNKWVTKHTGIYFQRARWKDLERIVNKTYCEFGYKNADAFVEDALSSSLRGEHEEHFINHLTIGETYFFREKRSLDIFEHQILPELIESRKNSSKHIRIWCSASSSGEEAYSIAIILSRVALLKGWKIEILASDINSDFIDRAKKGVYREWSFRGTPPDIKGNYFLETDEGNFAIIPKIRSMVNFSTFNLVKGVDSSRSGVGTSFLSNAGIMDVIFCRNVLIYFNQKQINNVSSRLCNSLINGGWLIVSPTEVSSITHPQLENVVFPGVTFFKKNINLEIKKNYFTDNSFFTQIEGNQVFDTDDSATETLLQAATGEHVEHEQDIDFTGSALFGENETIEIESTFLPEKPSNEPEKPASSEEIYLKASELCSKGLYEESVNILKELVLREPHHLKAATLLANLYANQGLLDEALEWSNKAISIDKMEPANYYLNAIILQEKGMTDDVVSTLKRAFYLDPDFILVHFMLGNITLQQGKTDEAEKHFKNALSLLGSHDPADILPCSDDGMTAGRLTEIINSMTKKTAALQF